MSTPGNAAVKLGPFLFFDRATLDFKTFTKFLFGVGAKRLFALLGPTWAICGKSTVVASNVTGLLQAGCPFDWLSQDRRKKGLDEMSFDLWRAGGLPYSERSVCFECSGELSHGELLAFNSDANRPAAGDVDIK